MKKIISILLMLVLVFSFGVTSFALESAEYYLEAIWDRFNDSSYHILDIRNDTRSLLSFVENINRNLDSIETINNNFYKSFFGDVVWGEPFGVFVQNSLNQITDVLANPEDEQIKENTQENKETIINNFFSPSSGNSLNSENISDFSGFVTDFKSVFNSSVLVPTSPFDIFQADSQALLWFSESTALSIDPEYSGGGSDPDPDEPDPDNPNPDNPDPDNPDPDNPNPDNPYPDNPDPDNPDPDNPDPDNPDPDEPNPDNPDPDEPDPDPEPIVNLLHVGTSTWNGSSILNGTGYANGYYYIKSTSSLIRRTSSSYSATGFIRVSASSGNRVYILNFVSDSNDKATGWVSAGTSSFYKKEIVGPDANGVYYFDLNDNTSIFAFTTHSSDASNLVITLNQYPIQSTTFNLRNPILSNPEVVTNYYNERNYLFDFFWDGDN